MSLSLILNVSQDPVLLETRSLILRAAGYVVESALSVKHALKQVQTGDFDLVLLCHSIPTKERERFICLVRASGSLIPMVSISASIGHADAFADRTIENNPKKTLKAIEEMLAKRAKKAEVGAAAPDSSADVRHPEPGLWSKTILCVDDEPNLLAMRRKLLENAGYSVLALSNGSDGLKVFSTGIADAVILDYTMPFMNGGAVAARMRQINSDVPLVLSSGTSDIPAEDLRWFDRFVPKGTSPTILLSAVEEVCFAPTRQKVYVQSEKQREPDFRHSRTPVIH